MKRELLVGLAVGLFMFCMVGSANATSFTQEFYVQIGSVYIEPWTNWRPGDYFNEQQAKRDYPGPSVGSRFFGAVTYNNANIPRTGTYIIGLADYVYGPNPLPFYPPLLVDEYQQDWVMDWKGWGFIFPQDVGHYDRHLYFKDRKLSGLYMTLLGGEGYLAETEFTGLGYNFAGLFLYGENQQYYAGAMIGGTLHVTPEPSTLLLLGSGLLGLIGFRRNFRKN